MMISGGFSVKAAKLLCWLNGGALALLAVVADFGCG